MARSGLGCLWRLSVLNPAFVAQIPAFLRFTLACQRLAVFVHFLLDEPCTFLDFTFTLMSISFWHFTADPRPPDQCANWLPLEKRGTIF